MLNPSHLHNGQFHIHNFFCVELLYILGYRFLIMSKVRKPQVGTKNNHGPKIDMIETKDYEENQIN